MTNRFMISVAALALLAGTGFANAQGMSGGQGSGGTQQMQHSTQPSGGAAERDGSMGKESKEKGTVGQAGGSSSMKSGQSAEDRSSGAMNKKEMNKNESAEDKAGMSKGSKAEERAQGEQHGKKSMSSENETKGGKKSLSSEENKSGNKNMKAEGRNGNLNAEGREGRPGTTTGGNMNAQGQTGTSTTTQTTGQAGAGAKLSTEQRTKITSVIREQHVQPMNDVNFQVAVGTRVPREHISLHPLPSEVVSIYPEWRGYEFVLVRHQIVVVDPNTYEIVAVLEV